MGFLYTLLVAYLIISLLVAIYRICSVVFYERNTRNIPIGELEFCERPPLFTDLTTIFFPATLIIILWVFLVMVLMNGIFD